MWEVSRPLGSKPFFIIEFDPVHTKSQKKWQYVCKRANFQKNLQYHSTRPYVATPTAITSLTKKERRNLNLWQFECKQTQTYTLSVIRLTDLVPTFRNMPEKTYDHKTNQQRTSQNKVKTRTFCWYGEMCSTTIPIKRIWQKIYRGALG